MESGDSVRLAASCNDTYELLLSVRVLLRAFLVRLWRLLHTSSPAVVHPPHFLFAPLQTAFVAETEVEPLVTKVSSGKRPVYHAFFCIACAWRVVATYPFPCRALPSLPPRAHSADARGAPEGCNLQRKGCTYANALHLRRHHGRPS